jgi:hypothetical protein
MFIRVEKIKLLCDNCGLCYRDITTDFSLFKDEKTARENAEAEDWCFMGQKHYCPNCYSRDSYNNLILNNPPKGIHPE